MLSRKVLIQNVENLTDARYYSAWGVDYLSFLFVNDEALSDRIERFKEITEWIEGPKLLADFDESDFLFIEAVIKEIKIDGIIHKQSHVLQSVHTKYLSMIKNEAEIKSFSNHENVVFRNANTLSIPEINELPSDIGIILTGSKEEKVGLKSYEEIDDIFESLESED